MNTHTHTCAEAEEHSEQRSSLFRAELKVTHPTQSGGVLANEGCPAGFF